MVADQNWAGVHSLKWVSSLLGHSAYWIRDQTAFLITRIILFAPN